MKVRITVATDHHTNTNYYWLTITDGMKTVLGEVLTNKAEAIAKALAYAPNNATMSHQ